MLTKMPKHNVRVKRPSTHATHRQSDPLIAAIFVRETVVPLKPALIAKVYAAARQKNVSIEQFIVSALYPSGENA